MAKKDLLQKTVPKAAQHLKNQLQQHHQKPSQSKQTDPSKQSERC